jgi:hypothetical protein
LQEIFYSFVIAKNGITEQFDVFIVVRITNYFSVIASKRSLRGNPFIANKASNQTTRSVPKSQILNMFIILNTDITSLRATNGSVAIHEHAVFLLKL